MGLRWDGEERRNPGRELRDAKRAEFLANMAPTAPLDVWLEQERDAWVNTRAALLEALYPLAVVTRDTFGEVTAMTAESVELELRHEQDNDPRTNYGAF